MTAPVPREVMPLREQMAFVLFREFVSGAPGAWDRDYSFDTHYRQECLRVADELLELIERNRDE